MSDYSWPYLLSLPYATRAMIVAGLVKRLKLRRIIEFGCGVSALPGLLSPDDFDWYVGVDPDATALALNGSSEKVRFVQSRLGEYQDEQDYDLVVGLGMDCSPPSLAGWMVDFALRVGAGCVVIEAADQFAGGRECYEIASARLSTRGFQRILDWSGRLGSATTWSIEWPDRTLSAWWRYDMDQRFVRTVQEHNPGMAQADDRSGNLGLGYLYYGVARCYLPKLALCVGSGYGFTFILVARGVQENRNGGRVICVDRGDGPEDSPWGGVGYWNRPIPEILAEFEGRYGLTNIEFRRESVEETFNALEERGERVGMFVHDADHSLPNVEHDFGRFLKVADVEWVALFHDAVSPEPSGVSPFLENLRGAGYQVFVFPQPAGLALVRPG